MKFGERLRKLRKERKLTQAELANSIGVSQPLLGRYESGEHEPTLGNLVKLADYFKLSLDELVGRVEQLDLFD